MFKTHTEGKDTFYHCISYYHDQKENALYLRNSSLMLGVCIVTLVCMPLI
jgi:hypothetical protein